MPFKSDAQRRWAHTPAGTRALGGPAAVAHWDAATKGRELPARVNPHAAKTAAARARFFAKVAEAAASNTLATYTQTRKPPTPPTNPLGTKPHGAKPQGPTAPKPPGTNPMAPGTSPDAPTPTDTIQSGLAQRSLDAHGEKFENINTLPVTT